MFHSARVKLTGWYLLIIMVISISFSGVIYHVLTTELDRLSRQQQFRMERRFVNREIILPDGTRFVPPMLIDTEILDDTKQRIFLTLVIINTSIFLISGSVGYFMAGRTLQPIQEMLDEQHRFVSDASHELRTPLTALKTTFEVNLREKNLSGSSAKEILKESLDQVNQLQSLSDRLLKLARYEQPSSAHITKIVSLSSLISTAVKKIHPLATQKHIPIREEISDFSFVCDPEDVVEVLIILLDNAVKYSPVNSTIDVVGKKKDKCAYIQVIDQGIGIEEDDLPHVFDRFYRADSARTRSGTHGHGLGLSIAKKIITVHDGSIKIKSTRNEGTTVTIKLPIA